MTEAMAREHSVEWIRDTLGALIRYEAASSAKDMRLSFIASQAAQHGGEAFEMMDEMLDKLDEQAKDEASSTDPDTSEEDQIRMQLMTRNPGAFQRVQVLDGGMADAS